MTSLNDSNRARLLSERRRAARALLREPLLRAHGHLNEDFRLVRRHAAELRQWFDRNTGWALHVDADTVRLRKTPGDIADPTHPAREVSGGHLPFSSRRYVLFCLALAVLERSETQIALGRLAEQVVLEAADPQLAAAGITFTMRDRDERADLVAAVRLLLRIGVLDRVAGDEDAYLKTAGDVLYDVRRRVLSAMLPGRLGPSTISAPSTAERVAALAAGPATELFDSSDLRNQALRQRITRRLLDDPVMYYAALGDDELTYLSGQRTALTGRVTELTGLVAEVRAEGIAMVDPDDDLTDVRMPEQGTHGHVTLLLAEHLAAVGGPVPVPELERRVRELGAEHASFWAKTARAPGAETGLVDRAVAKLEALRLITFTSAADGSRAVEPLPALARYAVGTPVVRESAAPVRRRTNP